MHGPLCDVFLLQRQQSTYQRKTGDFIQIARFHSPDTLDTIPNPHDTIHDTVYLGSARLRVKPELYLDSGLRVNVATAEVFNHTYLTLPWASFGTFPALKLRVDQPIGITPLLSYSRPAEFSYLYSKTGVKGTFPFVVNFHSTNYTGQLHVSDTAYVFLWPHDSIINVSPKVIYR